MKANRKRPTTLPLGTYSDASCKAEDRIDGLLPELERLKLLKADRLAVSKLAREYAAFSDDSRAHDLGCAMHCSPAAECTCSKANDDETLDHILSELIQIAENYLPEFCLLGNAEGDGACFGVWADVESAQRAVQDGEIWQALDDGTYRLWDAGVTDALTVPRGDLYLVVSDHGNVSLYRSIGGGRSREIWGVV